MKKKAYFTFFLSTILSISIGVIAYASTTVGTNISTGGTLSVTGLSSLGNVSSTNITASGDIQGIGNLILPASTATTGIIYSGGNLYMHSFGATTNFFAGTSAGNLTLTGASNTGIGELALFSLTSGTSNTAVARHALDLVTTGLQNTAVGRDAFSFITTGSGNTGIGFNAGRQNGRSLTGAGSNNTAVGTQTYSMPGGSHEGDANTAVGAFALQDASSSGNIALGYHAAAGGLYTGNQNIVIGYNIDAASFSTSNQLDIGNLIYGTGLDGTATTISSGKIGIATSTPSGTLHVAGTKPTIYVGGSALPGCLVMGDSSGIGLTYITTLSGVINATTTKPSACQ